MAGTPYTEENLEFARQDAKEMLAEADRLEAAMKREVENAKALGNAAKLREAVKLALSLLDLGEDVPSKAVKREDIDFMKAALSAPPHTGKWKNGRKYEYEYAYCSECGRMQ